MFDWKKLVRKYGEKVGMKTYWHKYTLRSVALCLRKTSSYSWVYDSKKMKACIITNSLNHNRVGFHCITNVSYIMSHKDIIAWI